MINQTESFLNDKNLARLLSLSPSWVRKQRWLRRHGQSHILTIDPIMIGSSPRYRQSSINSWLDNVGKPLTCGEA